MVKRTSSLLTSCLRRIKTQRTRHRREHLDVLAPVFGGLRDVAGLVYVYASYFQFVEQELMVAVAALRDCNCCNCRNKAHRMDATFATLGARDKEVADFCLEWDRLNTDEFHKKEVNDPLCNRLVCAYGRCDCIDSFRLTWDRLMATYRSRKTARRRHQRLMLR